MFFNLVGLKSAKMRAEMPITVLHRPNGSWSGIEVNRITNGLMTMTEGRPSHPEYLLLNGHFTKEKILSAICGGPVFTVAQVTGADNEALPFTPSFDL